MAKGQRRSNREIRKPKQNKALPKPENALGNQVKFGAKTDARRGKG